MAVPAEPARDNFNEQEPFGFADRNISLDSVLEMNRSIQSGVETGRVTRQQGRRAQNITLDLRRYLADLDAEIQKTEDLILDMDDGKRFEMIRHFSRLVGRRERALVSSYLALEDIDSSIDSTGSGTIEEPSSEPTSSSDRNELDVEIELVPKDRLMEDLE